MILSPCLADISMCSDQDYIIDKKIILGNLRLVSGGGREKVIISR